MTTTNLSILIDKGLKEEAEEVYKELGLTLSGAICLFLRATMTERGLPFALKLGEPSETTSKAIEEGRRLLKDPDGERFSSAEDLRESLGV